MKNKIVLFWSFVLPAVSSIKGMEYFFGEAIVVPINFPTILIYSFGGSGIGDWGLGNK